MKQTLSLLLLLCNVILISAAADKKPLITTTLYPFEGVPITLTCRENNQQHIAVFYRRNKSNSSVIVVFDKHGKADEIADFFATTTIKQDAEDEAKAIEDRIAHIRRYVRKTDPLSARFNMAGIIKRGSTFYYLKSSYLRLKHPLYSTYHTELAKYIRSTEVLELALKPDSVQIALPGSNHEAEIILLNEKVKQIEPDTAAQEMVSQTAPAVATFFSEDPDYAKQSPSKKITPLCKIFC